MFSFFKKKSAVSEIDEAEKEGSEAQAASQLEDKRSWLDRLRGQPAAAAAPATETASVEVPSAERSASATPVEAATSKEPAPEESSRRNWMEKLRGGLRRTGSSIAQVFVGAQITDELYEELETALLMADAGVKATQFLLDDLKRRVKESKPSNVAALKDLLTDAVAELLMPIEGALRVGRYEPTVIMVVGVNGAGKTTSIGKLTRHLVDADRKVLLAAADTFRAAAREQLMVWAGRNSVEIVGQDQGDPAAVTFDAVTAGKARGHDVVIADTAGRLTTQLHLMEELKKIRRVIAKADATAPHEVLLVVDGNTGQNALNQVQAFDAALQPHGFDRHETRWNRQRWRAGRHCVMGSRACCAWRAGRAGLLHWCWRKTRRSANLRCARVCAGFAGLTYALPSNGGECSVFAKRHVARVQVIKPG